MSPYKTLSLCADSSDRRIVNNYLHATSTAAKLLSPTFYEGIVCENLIIQPQMFLPSPKHLLDKLTPYLHRVSNTSSAMLPIHIQTIESLRSLALWSRMTLRNHETQYAIFHHHPVIANPNRHIKSFLCI